MFLLPNFVNVDTDGILHFQKGGKALIKCYEDSHIRVLQSLYPELNLKEEGFLGHLGMMKYF
jgi:hypothetical protein